LAPPSKRAAFASPTVASLPSPRTITPASKALADKATKVATAVQVNISFGTVDKYKAGLKILLPETIYGNDEVS
jgi:hypothetical protein